MATKGLPPDVVRARIDELVGLWRDDPHDSVEVLRRDSDAVGLTVFGLAAHTYSLAAAVRSLDDVGGEPTMVPLVRQMLECAVTAMWVEKYNARAAKTVAKEQARGRLLVLKNFLDAGVPDDGSIAKWQATIDELDLDAGKSGEKLWQRCEELEGLKSTYAMYRALSSVSHADGAVVDLYARTVDPTAEHPVGVQLAAAPKQWLRDNVMSVALVYLLLAGRAWDRLDRHHRSRTRLKQIAAEAGVKLAWTQSAVGLRRQAEWERAQRERRRSTPSAQRGLPSLADDVKRRN